MLTLDVSPPVQDAVAHRQRQMTFEIRVPEQFESDAAYGRRLDAYQGVRLCTEYNSVPTDRQRPPVQRWPPLHPTEAVPAHRRVRKRAAGGGLRPGRQREWASVTEVAIWPKATRTPGRCSPASTASPVGPTPSTCPTDPSSTGVVRLAGPGDRRHRRLGVVEEVLLHLRRHRARRPTVTSANYPANSTGEWAPAGVPGTFTFSGNGNKDVAGFEYSWRGLGVPAARPAVTTVSWSARTRSTSPGSVRADKPGGSATVTINPIDSERRRSPSGRSTWPATAPGASSTRPSCRETAPEVRVEGGQPEWGQEVLLKLVPANGVTGVFEYEITLDGGEHRRPGRGGGRHGVLPVHRQQPRRAPRLRTQPQRQRLRVAGGRLGRPTSCPGRG